MILARWFLTLVAHIACMAVVNKSYFFAGTVLFLLLLGVIIASVQATAPWIYTLF